MENMETAEVLEENVEATAEPKAGLKDRFVGSRPVQWCKRHAKGLAAGAATVAAVGVAAVLAGKAAADGAIDVPLSLDEAADAIPEIGSEE